MLTGTWWLASYTLTGAATVTVPKSRQTVALTISAGGFIETDICEGGQMGLYGGQVRVDWEDGGSPPRSCPEDRLLTAEQQAVLTGTIDYTVDRLNLTFTHPGVGTLVFVSNCDGPSVTPSSGIMQPMYISCRSMQQAQQSAGK